MSHRFSFFKKIKKNFDSKYLGGTPIIKKTFWIFSSSSGPILRDIVRMAILSKNTFFLQKADSVTNPPFRYIPVEINESLPPAPVTWFRKNCLRYMYAHGEYMYAK